MELKASAQSRIAAHRMSPYSGRYLCSQLGCLLLALAVLSLPLAGRKTASEPILVPLATRLVPLGPGLEAPQPPPLHVPDSAAPLKIVFGLPAVLGIHPRDCNHAIRLPASLMTDSLRGLTPNGRSPPPAV